MDSGTIDKFGNSTVTAKDGKDGLLSLVKWFEPLIYEWWKKVELISFYFENETDGFVYDKNKTPIGLKNFATGTSGNAQYPVETLTKLFSQYYALQFNRSLYIVVNIDFCYGDFMKAVLLVSFKISKLPKTSQTICTTEDASRGVTVKLQHLSILNGEKSSVKVPYKFGEWNTLYVVWNTNGTSHFQINDTTGHFRTEPVQSYASLFLYLGANGTRSGVGTNFFRGEIAKFDFYSTRGATEELPICLKELLIKTHKDIVG